MPGTVETGGGWVGGACGNWVHEVSVAVRLLGGGTEKLNMPSDDDVAHHLVELFFLFHPIKMLICS